MTNTPSLYNLTDDELTQLVLTLEEKKFRTKQIKEWLYIHTVQDFAEMTNLSKSFRQKLAQHATILPFQLVDTQYSRDKQTKKVLFQLHDGHYIETVLMEYDRRQTVCISTQAGCAMGCVFCATGQMGFMRNLTVGEIVAQVFFFAHELAQQGQRVTNIVFMGMGEPLHNYDATLSALDRLTDGQGFNLGARRITISTVGLVPAIRRYADEKRATPLAVSLHAAVNRDRNLLIPINRKWSLGDLMEACHYYIEQTGRRITFEWALIAGKNDTIKQASKLGELLEGMLCHVNLIPLNPIHNYEGQPSSPERVEVFQNELSRFGVSSTVRVRRGIDIQAGCGQLRDRIIAGQALAAG